MSLRETFDGQSPLYAASIVPPDLAAAAIACLRRHGALDLAPLLGLEDT